MKFALTKKCCLNIYIYIWRNLVRRKRVMKTLVLVEGTRNKSETEIKEVVFTTYIFFSFSFSLFFQFTFSSLSFFFFYIKDLRGSQSTDTPEFSTHQTD